MCHITFALHVGGGGGGWRWELKARRPPSQWPQLDTFNIFCVRPLDIFQDTSGQFPASFTATKKNGIFNRSQDISRRVCTNRNTRWAKTSPKYVKFNRHALKRVSFFIVFHFSSLFGLSKPDELFFRYVLKWPLDTIILRLSDVSLPLHRDLLKK